jgi:hypothetical protein
VLQDIVKTIDRFGLKKYHLNKHKREVRRFYDKVFATTFTSEIALGYQKRIEKYRDKLFVFLNYDGVPWNNNTAENAVKLIASRRKLVGTGFTENGIRNYLILLSIYQTLRYRSASLWEFLLSGESSVESFFNNRQWYSVLKLGKDMASMTFNVWIVGRSDDDRPDVSAEHGFRLWRGGSWLPSFQLLLGESSVDQREDGFTDIGIEMGPSVGDIEQGCLVVGVIQCRAEAVTAGRALPRYSQLGWRFP